MAKDILQIKSFQFSIDIVNIYKYLSQEKKEFILSKQVLRSGTSIGANVSEANYGQSYKDFIHKLQISRKDASETIYWLNLLHATEYINSDTHKKSVKECSELLKILTSSIITVERKLGVPSR